MKRNGKNSGFSLAEVLMSVGILAIGMMFIAGVFPAAIYYSTIATERTIAATVADEAFAKVAIYGRDPSAAAVKTDFSASPLVVNETVDFNSLEILLPDIAKMKPEDFAYPSTDYDVSRKQYCWSALCRPIDPNERLLQVTVFVSRKPGSNLMYYKPQFNISLLSLGADYGTVDWGVSPMVYLDWPRPVKVEVTKGADNILKITLEEEFTFINDGYTILDNKTGQMYRVLERRPEDNAIVLDRPWDTGSDPAFVWVVPPPMNGGRRPCIAVYQRIMKF